MFRVLKKINKKEWLMILISILFIVTQVWLDLKLPDYMSEITILVQTEGSKIIDVLKSGLYMILCALGSLISSFIVGFFASKVGLSLAKKLRSLLFDKVASFSLKEINHFSTASLITRSTNDVMHVQMFIIMALQMLIKAPITAIWAVTKIMGKGIEWSVATGIATTLIIILMIIVMIIVLPKFKKMQDLIDSLTKVAQENLTGLKVVRAYNAENYQQNKFNHANEELTKTNRFVQRTMSIMFPFLGILMNTLPLVIYFIGAILINEANIMDKLLIFSNMIVFSQYAIQVIMSFMFLIMLFIFLPRASVAAKRINEVLDMKLSIVDGNKTKGINNLKGEIEFKNVSFKFPKGSNYVLENINFKIKQGQTTAFIGSTGSGKTTLMYLILRFFDPTIGVITLNGVNIKEYKLEYLYDKIGYIPQKTVLFKGTIAKNITIGSKKNNQNKINLALKIAQANNFVKKMKNQTKSLISQRGTNISGGQKQRLAIARAIYRNPEIYIFDDSFSALDYKTDKNLRNELMKFDQDSTKIIIAQRVGTIMNADQIIVLDEGKIVGKGTHEQLLKNCSVYKEIASTQLSESELIR